MPMDKRSTSFEIHWDHDQRHISAPEVDHIPYEGGGRLLDRITSQLEDAGAEAVHVLAYWRQIRARYQDLDAPMHADVLQELIGAIQILEDLYWGVELTLASGKQV
ncbi:MAG: hypothetical protein RIQ52_645 [Pseudomonadota bacterium]|jgi:hypothetical protein